MTSHLEDSTRDSAVFLVRDGLAAGLGRGELAHPTWNQPFHGLRTRAALGGSLAERAQQYIPRLRRGEYFSHATALALLGCPIRVPVGHGVDVSSPVKFGAVACAGVIGHRYREPALSYSCLLPDRSGRVPISIPFAAVREAALQLSFPELVVALDHLLRDETRRFDRHLRVSVAQVAEYAATATGRGAVRFRSAASLARVGAESRMETLMRLCAVAAGMPELTLQAEIRDASGRWIGRFDAADLESRSLFEFDGEQHFYSAPQRQRDAVKHQQARDAGWRILVCYARDVIDRPRDTGRRMLAFTGRAPERVPVALSRLLDERSGEDTESAIHYQRFDLAK